MYLWIMSTIGCCSTDQAGSRSKPYPTEGVLAVYPPAEITVPSTKRFADGVDVGVTGTDVSTVSTGTVVIGTLEVAATSEVDVDTTDPPDDVEPKPPDEPSDRISGSAPSPQPTNNPSTTQKPPTHQPETRQALITTFSRRQHRGPTPTKHTAR